MRSRNIKNGFWVSEDVADLSFMGRLLFLGLLAMADRNGVVKSRARGMKGALFPFDAVTVEEIEDQLNRMAGLGMVTRYRDADGVDYVHVTNFYKHQSLSNSEKKRGKLNGPIPVVGEVEIVSGNGLKKSDQGQTSVRPRSDQGQTKVCHESENLRHILKSEIGNLKSLSEREGERILLSLIDSMPSLTAEQILRAQQAWPMVKGDRMFEMLDEAAVSAACQVGGIDNPYRFVLKQFERVGRMEAERGDVGDDAPSAWKPEVG